MWPVGLVSAWPQQHPRKACGPSVSLLSSGRGLLVPSRRRSVLLLCPSSPSDRDSSGAGACLHLHLSASHTSSRSKQQMCELKWVFLSCKMGSFMCHITDLDIHQFSNYVLKTSTPKVAFQGEECSMLVLQTRGSYRRRVRTAALGWRCQALW